MAAMRLDIILGVPGGADAGKAFTDLRGHIEGVGSTLRRVFEVAAGVNFANMFSQGVTAAKEFVRELATLGLEANNQEEVFRRLTASLGVSGDALLEGLQKASGGVLDTTDVMRRAALALRQGFDTEQIVKLMEVARVTARALGRDTVEVFNDMSAAIANNQPKLLKQLEINIDATAAEEAHKKALGATTKELTESGKAHALYNAVIDDAQPKLAALSSLTLSQKEEVARLRAEWGNFKDTLGQVIVDAGIPMLGWLRNLRDEIASSEWFAGITDSFAGFRDWAADSDIATAAAAQLRAVVLSLTVAFDELISGPVGLYVVGPIVKGLTLSFALLGEGIAAVLVPINMLFVGLRGMAEIGSLIARGEFFSAEAWARLRQNMNPSIEGLKEQIRLAQAAHQATLDLEKRMSTPPKMGGDLDALVTKTKASLDSLGASASKLGDGLGRKLPEQTRTSEANLKSLGAEAEKAAKKAYDAWKIGWEDAIDPLNTAAERATLAIGAFETRLQNTNLSTAYRRSLQDVQYGLEGVGNATVDIVDVQNQGVESTEELSDSLDKLPLLTTSEKISALSDLIDELRDNGVDPTSEAFTVLGNALHDAFRADTAQSLAMIGVQAQILGANFDAVGAGVSVARREWEQAVAAYDNGRISLDQLTASGERFNAALADQSIYDAIEGSLLSITDTVTTMVDAWVRGTLTWKSTGETLLGFLLNFGQTVLHDVLDPIMKGLARTASAWLSSFLFGSTGTSSMGVLGSIVGGRGQAYGTGDLLGPPSPSGSGSVGDMLSSAASGLSTAYSVVAEMANLPSLTSLAAQGLTSLGTALGIIGPNVASLTGGIVGLGSAATGAFGPISAASLSAAASGGAFGGGASGAAVGATAGLGAAGWALGGAALPSLIVGIGTWLQAAARAEMRWREAHQERQAAAMATDVGASLEGLTLTNALEGTRRRNLEALKFYAQTYALVPEESERMRLAGTLPENRVPGQNYDEQGRPRFDVAIEQSPVLEAARSLFDSLTQLGIEASYDWALATKELGGSNMFRDMGYWNKLVVEFAGAFERLLGTTKKGTTDTEREADLQQTRMRLEAALTADAYNTVADALGVARQAAPDFAQWVTAAPEEIEQVIKGMASGLTKAITESAIADPAKIATLLLHANALGSLAREGEDAAVTVERVGTAFVALTEYATSLRDEAEAMRLQGASVLERLRANLMDVDLHMAAVQSRLDRALGAEHFQALDPEAALTAARELRDLTMQRYDLEIAAVTELLGSIRSLADSVTAVADTVATGAPFLRQIGIDIGGATRSMLAFARSLPDAGARITALGGAMRLFLAQVSGVTGDIAALLAAAPTPAEAAKPLEGAALDARIQEILHPLLAGATPALSAAQIIEAEVQKIREGIQGPRDVGAAQAAIAAMLARQPALEAFLGEQETLRTAPEVGAPGGPSAADKLLELVPNAGDLLEGIKGGFIAALEVTDAGERATALNSIFSLLSSGVGQIETLLSQSGLSTKEQTAVMEQVLGAVGPLGKDMYDAMVAAASDQAAAARAAADQLRDIIGPDYATAQNFIADKTGAIAAAMDDLATNITDPLERAIGAAANSIVAAIPQPVVVQSLSLSEVPQLQTGADLVRGGLYRLHQGEGVYTPQANAVLRDLGLTNATLTRAAMVGTGSTANAGAPIPVAFQFGDIHVGNGANARDAAHEIIAVATEALNGDFGAAVTRRVTGKR